MTYQANFPNYTPPQPTPPMSSLVEQVIADPPRHGFLGILARRGLARFMLSRIPEQSPASQATCPYVPFHVGAIGQSYPVTPVDVNSVLTADQREAKVVPAYAQNVAVQANDQEIGEPILPVDTLDARPFREDFIAGVDDSIPETPPAVIPTYPVSDQPQNLDGR